MEKRKGVMRSIPPKSKKKKKREKKTTQGMPDTYKRKLEWKVLVECVQRGKWKEKKHNERR